PPTSRLVRLVARRQLGYERVVARIRVEQVVARDADRREHRLRVARDRIDRDCRLEVADPQRATFLQRQGRRTEREIGLAHESEHGAYRPGAEAEHHRPADELLSIELRRHELVDEVVLDGAGFAPAVLPDPPARLTIHPKVSLRSWGSADRGVLRTD